MSTLNAREKRWLREARSLWRSIASGNFGSRLDDDSYRQAMLRLAEAEAVRCHRRLVRSEEMLRRSRSQKAVSQ